MMTPTSGDSPSNSSTRAGRKGLLMAVAGTAAALVIVTIFIGKTMTGAGPAAATAAPKVGVAESVEAGLAAATEYTRQKQFTEAAAICAKLAERAPTDQAVRVAYAQALIGQQKHVEAYEQYEAAISLSGDINAKPSSIKRSGGGGEGEQPKVERNPTGAALHFEAGTSANAAGKPERAVEHYWMAQVLDPADARYPLFLAMMQIKTGDREAATASLLRAVKLKPELAEGWGTLAELSLQQNRLGLAEQHLKRARELQPQVTRWRLVEARIANRNNKPEQAAQILMALDDGARTNKDALALISETFGLLDRPADAAKAWAAATKAHPQDADVYYQAALWAQKAKNTAEAKSFARTAAMLGNADAKALAEQLASTPN